MYTIGNVYGAWQTAWNTFHTQRNTQLVSENRFKK